MGPNMIHGPIDQIRCRSTLTDSGHWLVSMIPVDSEEILMWDHLDWLPYQISFPSIYGSSKTESGYVLGDQFKANWSWRPRQTWTWVALASTLGTRTELALGLLVDLDTRADLLGLYMVLQAWSYVWRSCPHHPPFLVEKPSSVSILLEVDPAQQEDKQGFQNNGNRQCCEKEYDHMSRFIAYFVL